MLTLYFAPGTSSMAVHIALHEIGAAFEGKPMSFKANDMQSPEFLKLNPADQVPTVSLATSTTSQTSPLTIPEDYMRDVMGLEIGDGTAQIMKLIIAREKAGRMAAQHLARGGGTGRS